MVWYAFSDLQEYYLTVSEVGFGLWTISTGWWGNFTEGEAIALMHKAFDLGVTLFDAAHTYGNGLSEELIAKAFPNQRDEIAIATKVGYDFVHHGEARGRGQREIPHDFSPDAVTRATDAALNRLKTDRIDLLQLHNIRMDQVYDDVFDERALLIETNLGNRWMKVLAAQLHEQTSQFPQALTGAQ
jgi:aryl-alcohol dehydrogenase-like predicted oxidoreductase